MISCEDLQFILRETFLIAKPLSMASIFDCISFRNYGINDAVHLI